MTDKRIKSFLEDRLKRLESIRNEREWTTAELGDIACCKQTLAFIDSMQEEPVSGLDYGNMPIERWKQAVKAASNQRNYRSSKGLTETKDDYFVDGVLWADEHPKEEPVSEELEEASLEYFKQAIKDGDKTKLDAFKAGAKWQAERFEKNRLKHCNSITNEQAELEQGFIDQHLDKHQRMPTFLDAIEFGMEKMKQQMMAKAIDIEVKVDAGGYPYIPQMELYDYDNDVPLAKEGDKYKVILIK